MCTSVRISFVLLVGLAAFVAAGDEDTYTLNQHSRPLTASTFPGEVNSNNLLVFFHGAGCPLTQKFIGKYEQIAETFQTGTNVVFATVDCDSEASLCATQHAEAYHLYLYVRNSETPRVKFNGVRDVNGISRFLIKHLGDDALEGTVLDVPRSLDAINVLTSENFADHVAVGEHFIKFYAPWCGHCQRMAATWDELAVALEYDSSVSISKIDCTQHRPICVDYEVKGYPTLLWIVDGKRVEKYTGSRTLDELKAYVEGKATTDNDAPAIHHTVKSELVEDSGVLLITKANFEHAVERGVTFIKFYAPWCGHCKRMAPSWEELAGKFVDDSAVKIAKVDCTLSDNKDLCTEQNVNGFPTIFIYRDGAKITEYNGNRSLEDLYEFVKKHSQRDEL